MASAATLLTVAIAGCGASNAPSLSAFKTGFASDKAQFRKLGLDLQREIVGAKAKTDAQLATDLGALSVRAKQQAAQLSKLDPPAKYKAELQKLVSGFNAVGADLKQISVAATRHDGPTARTATGALGADAAKVKASDDAITAGLGLPKQS
ncbi:MAG: hypothetical protein ACR2MK_02115 [Solirubrobacteraceae bacterium]